MGSGKKRMIPNAEKNIAVFSPYLSLSLHPIVYHTPIYITKMITPNKKASISIFYISDITTYTTNAYTASSTYGLPFDLSFQKNFILSFPVFYITYIIIIYSTLIRFYIKSISWHYRPQGDSNPCCRRERAVS